MSEKEKFDQPEKRHYERPPVFLEGCVSDLEAREAKRHKREDKYRTLQLWFNFLLFVVGSITAGVYLYQAHIMRESLQVTTKSADAATSAAKTAERTLAHAGESFSKTLEQMKAQARASQNSADAAIRSARVSEIALDNTAKQFDISMRPYVGMSKVELSTELKIGEVLNHRLPENHKLPNELVADQFAAAAGEDGRQTGQARTVLLADAGREPSHTAVVREHDPAD